MIKDQPGLRLVASDLPRSSLHKRFPVASVDKGFCLVALFTVFTLLMGGSRLASLHIPRVMPRRCQHCLSQSMFCFGICGNGDELDKGFVNFLF